MLPANVAPWIARWDWIGATYWIGATGDWIATDRVGDISIPQRPYILDVYPQIITGIDTAN